MRLTEPLENRLRVSGKGERFREPPEHALLITKYTVKRKDIEI